MFRRVQDEVHFMKSVPSETNVNMNAGSRLLRSALANRRTAQQPEQPAIVSFEKAQRRNWEGDEVRVKLGALLPILLQAALDRSAWLDDFESETLVVSKDLHEVLSTYQRLHAKRRAA